MKYHTADGHEIVRDGVYKSLAWHKFICLGFKADLRPIVGYFPVDDGEACIAAYKPSDLTLWREPAEQVEVWEVVTKLPDYGRIVRHEFSSEAAAYTHSAKCKGKTLRIRLKETITVGGV